MTKIESENIQCSNCKYNFSVDTYESINTEINPDLKEKLLNNEINKAVCPKCKQENKISIPVLYHDMQNQIMIYVLPFSGEGIPQKERTELIPLFINKLKEFSQFIDDLEYTYDIVFSINELKESLKKIEANDCDDKIKDITKKVLGNNLKSTTNDKTSDKDLEILRRKPYFRFLKVIYIILFFISIIFLIIKMDFGEKEGHVIRNVIDYEKSSIICNNNNQYKLIEFDDIKNEINHIKFYGIKADYKGFNKLKKICFTGELSSKDNIENYSVNFKINFIYKDLWGNFFKFWILKFFLFVFSLISIFVIFEVIRQLTYYVFLGKIYLHRRIDKIINR